MDEKTIQRIKKLQALAERGVGGEKTTAQKKPLEPEQTAQYKFSDLQMSLYYTIYI